MVLYGIFTNTLQVIPDQESLEKLEAKTVIHTDLLSEVLLLASYESTSSFPMISFLGE